MRYNGPTQQQQAWNKLVRHGVELPGVEGTYWRLLRRLPVEEVGRWCVGENLRQVPMPMVMDAIEMFIASCVTQVAGRTGRKLVMESAARILRRTANIVHADVTKIVDDKEVFEKLARKASTH